MSRVDVPTLMCDRCETKTTDTKEMGGYTKMYQSGFPHEQEWDFCPDCGEDFEKFLIGTLQYGLRAAK